MTMEDGERIGMVRDGFGNGEMCWILVIRFPFSSSSSSSSSSASSSLFFYPQALLSFGGLCLAIVARAECSDLTANVNVGVPRAL